MLSHRVTIQAIMYETGQAGQTHTIWEQLIDTIDKLYEPYFAWLFIMQANHLTAAPAMPCYCQSPKQLYLSSGDFHETAG